MSNAVAGRIGDPDEIAALCVFLCGRQSGYITGQNIMVDGGAYPVTL
jgi:3-oxoacyl-[acyl-carrier protein] reductase